MYLNYLPANLNIKDFEKKSHLFLLQAFCQGREGNYSKVAPF